MKRYRFKKSFILLIFLFQNISGDSLYSLHNRVYTLLKINSNDSAIIDSSLVCREKLNNTFRYLSAVVDKNIFSSYQDLKMLRLFEPKEHLHVLQIFFLKMNRSTIDNFKNSMTGRTIGSVQSKMWNKYYVYFTSEMIIFVESFAAIDNGFMRQLQNYFYRIEIDASKYNRNDSLYYCDTLLRIRQIYECNEKIIEKLPSIQPIDSVSQDTKFVKGLIKKGNNYTFKWLYKKDSLSGCVALKINRKIPVQAVIKLIYDQEPFVEKKSENENYYLQYRSKCYAPITLWIDNNNCIEMITLRKLNEKQKTPCRMCLN